MIGQIQYVFGKNSESGPACIKSSSEILKSLIFKSNTLGTWYVCKNITLLIDLQEKNQECLRWKTA